MSKTNKTIIFALVLLFAMSLAACSDGAQQTESRETEVQETETQETETQETQETLQTEAQPVFSEVPVGEAKRTLLTLSIGVEDGQVGYYHNSKDGFITGPEAFAVADGVICILDNANHRVVVYENGRFSTIDISDCPGAMHINYGNGNIVVVDNSYKRVGVYSVDGTWKELIPYPEAIKGTLIASVQTVGAHYVDVEILSNDVYRLDWESDTANKTERLWWYKRFFQESDIENRIRTVGINLEDGGSVYVKLDYSGHYKTPLDSFYYTEEGKIYYMECFEDKVVISEIVLLN